MNRHVMCGYCQGMGLVKKESHFVVREVNCSECNGEGIISKPIQEEEEEIESKEELEGGRGEER